MWFLEGAADRLLIVSSNNSRMSLKNEEDVLWKKFEYRKTAQIWEGQVIMLVRCSVLSCFDITHHNMAKSN